MIDAISQATSLPALGPGQPDEGIASSDARSLPPVTANGAATTGPLAQGPALERSPGAGKVVAAEDNYGIGWVDDGYDLRLIRESEDSYRLELTMDIEVAFLKGRFGNDWTESQKQRYLATFEREIMEVWDGHSIPNGRDLPPEERPDVRLDLNLNVTEREDHWIDTGWNDAEFLTDTRRWARAHAPTPEPHWIVEAVATRGDGSAGLTDSYSQTLRIYGPADQVQEIERDGRTLVQGTVAHEFGHMLGISTGDEYWFYSPHSDDAQSIMHSGEQVRPRHFRELEHWIDSVLHDTAPIAY